jgi:hypothetical protein
MSSPQPTRGLKALEEVRKIPRIRDSPNHNFSSKEQSPKPVKIKKLLTAEEAKEIETEYFRKLQRKTRVKAFLKAPIASTIVWLKKRKKNSMSASPSGPAPTPEPEHEPAPVPAPAPAPADPMPTPASASAATSGGGGASAPTTAPSPAPITINCTPSGGGNGVNLVVIALLAVICFGIWLLTFRGQDVTSAINSAHERELEAVKKEQEGA